MKALWQRVIPMLRCWRVLIPLKMMAGYEEVITTLEREAMKPERIKQNFIPLAAVPDADDKSADERLVIYHLP
jgi:hypothetical protein